MERTAPEIIQYLHLHNIPKILIRLPVPYSIRLAITTIPVIQAALPIHAATSYIELVCCYTVQYYSAAEAEGSSQKVHELCFVFWNDKPS